MQHQWHNGELKAVSKFVGLVVTSRSGLIMYNAQTFCHAKRKRLRMTYDFRSDLLLSAMRQPLLQLASYLCCAVTILSHLLHPISLICHLSITISQSPSINSYTPSLNVPLLCQRFHLHLSRSCFFCLSSPLLQQVLSDGCHPSSLSILHTSQPITESTAEAGIERIGPELLGDEERTHLQAQLPKSHRDACPKSVTAA